jgi:hypothetical protein
LFEGGIFVNWDWFQYIYYISLVLLIFSFLWKWIVILPISVVEALINSNTFVLINILNFVGQYLLASFLALYGIGINLESHNSLGYSIFIYCIGGFILLFQGSLNLVNIEKEAMATGDYKLLKNKRFNYLSFLFGIGMYISIIIFPNLGVNQPVIWFLGVMQYISGIKFLGWILNGIAFLNALNIIFMGFIALIGLVAALFSRKNDNEINF